MSIKITTLIEDMLGDNRDLKIEHGLSLFIEKDNQKILFDTGKSGDFIDNANKLGVNLNNTDYIVLSHGHYDHTGGLKRFIKLYGDNIKKLVINKKMLSKKYKKINDELKYIGIDFDENYLNENVDCIHYIQDDIEKLAEDVYVVTNYNRNNGFEKQNSKFLSLVSDKYVMDTFTEEVSVVIDYNEGLIVLLGCSHIGVVNILTGIKNKFKKNIYAVIGGTHLVNADKERINKTMDFFKQENIKLIGVCHCTGEKTENMMKQEFTHNFINNHTGSVVKLI